MFKEKGSSVSQFPKNELCRATEESIIEDTRGSRQSGAVTGVALPPRDSQQLEVRQERAVTGDEYSRSLCPPERPGTGRNSRFGKQVTKRLVASIDCPLCRAELPLKVRRARAREKRSIESVGGAPFTNCSNSRSSGEGSPVPAEHSPSGGVHLPGRGERRAEIVQHTGQPRTVITERGRIRI